jgi:hypothetical protein
MKTELNKTTTKISKIIFLFIVIISFTKCGKKDILLGKWERISDEYKGMQVSVIKNNDQSYSATIVNRPNNPNSFNVGDVKWKDIKESGEDRYVFFDLYKTLNLNEDANSNYRETTMIIIGDTLKTRVFSKENESVGTNQMWIKINE